MVQYCDTCRNCEEAIFSIGHKAIFNLVLTSICPKWRAAKSPLVTLITCFCCWEELENVWTVVEWLSDWMIERVGMGSSTAECSHQTQVGVYLCSWSSEEATPEQSRPYAYTASHPHLDPLSELKRLVATRTRLLSLYRQSIVQWNRGC
jgi:hypothetical protein